MSHAPSRLELQRLPAPPGDDLASRDRLLSVTDIVRRRHFVVAPARVVVRQATVALKTRESRKALCYHLARCGTFGFGRREMAGIPGTAPRLIKRRAFAAFSIKKVVHGVMLLRKTRFIGITKRTARAGEGEWP
jgi:hypothetical protein